MQRPLFPFCSGGDDRGRWDCWWSLVECVGVDVERRQSSGKGWAGSEWVDGRCVVVGWEVTSPTSLPAQDSGIESSWVELSRVSQGRLGLDLVSKP